MLFGPELNRSEFVIAEVGANHLGNLNIAKQFISVFAATGVQAIKFQTRNNRYLFAPSSYNRVYNSEASFGATYGEHREALEFSVEELTELKAECARHNVLFMSTAFDEPSLEVLVKLGVDAIKISSFDCGNTPFLEKIAQTEFPVVLSTGGCGLDAIQESVSIFEDKEADLALLHCVSEYPCEAKKMNLRRISVLQELFPGTTIGLSDHFKGIISGPIAYLLGARVFEKHVTLDRTWKGTDQAFSLMPEGMRKFCRDIGRVEDFLNSDAENEVGSEPVFSKLGKTVAVSRDLMVGDQLNSDTMTGRIFVEDGIPVRDAWKFIGKTLKTSKKAGEQISWLDIDV